MSIDNIITLLTVLSSAKCFIQHNAIPLFKFKNNIEKGIELKKTVVYVLVLTLFVQIVFSLTASAQIPTWQVAPSQSYSTPLYLYVLAIVLIVLVVVGLVVLIVFLRRRNASKRPINQAKGSM